MKSCELTEEQLRDFLAKPALCPWCGGEVVLDCLEGEANFALSTAYCEDCGRQWDLIYRAVGIYIPETQEHRYLPENDPRNDERALGALHKANAL